MADPNDHTLLEPVPGGPFSPLVMFTCTFEAQIANINRSHVELTDVLGPRVASGAGPVKALNSNFGHYCQPGFERFLKQPKPPTPRRGGQLTAAITRPRKPQGDATCFNSALELIIIPGPEDDPPPEVQIVNAEHPGKYYAVKSFPTTGQTQVPGVICPRLTDGAYVARLWAAFLTDAGVGIDPSEPVTVRSEHPIMINFKFHLVRRSARVIFNLVRMVEYLEATKHQKNAGLPFPIREIKHPQDGQNLSFKFVYPVLGREEPKKIRVNIFYQGKVNILGACDFDGPRIIYSYLGNLICDHWRNFIGLRPLPDTRMVNEIKILPAENDNRAGENSEQSAPVDAGACR